MKKTFLIVLMFCLNVINAQSIEKEKVMQSKEYLEFKHNFIEYYTSDLFFKKELINQEFKKKSKLEILHSNEKDFLTWLEKNLDNTDFKSKEEAIELRREFDNLFDLNQSASEKIFKDQITLEKKYSKHIISDLVDNDIYKELKPKQLELIKKWKIE